MPAALTAPAIPRTRMSSSSVFGDLRSDSIACSSTVSSATSAGLL